MDARLRDALEMEDPDVIVDLVHGNNGQTTDKFRGWYPSVSIQQV